MAKRIKKEPAAEDQVELHVEAHPDPLSHEPEVHTLMVRIIDWDGYTLVECSVPPKLSPCFVTKTMVTSVSPRAPTLFRSNSIPDELWDRLAKLRDGVDVQGVGRVNERGIRFLDYDNEEEFTQTVKALWESQP